MTEEEYTRFNQMFKSMGNDPMMMYRAKSPFENNRDEFNDVLNYAPTEGQQTYSIGTDDAGNEILGNTINDVMAQPQPKEEDNSFFAGTSWGGDINAAEASERILADEEGGETNLPELIDGGRVDLGQELSALHDRMKDTSLYAQYMYSADDWAEKGKEIFDETGMEIPPGDKNIFEKAWNLTREIKRQKALATDASGHVNMDKVYEAMPYLRDIHEAHGTAAAVMVMNSAKELQTINDVYDSEAARFAASIGYGIYRGGLSVVNQYTGAKAMARGLWSNKGLTQEEMNDILWVADEMKKLPQNSYSSFGSILGGVLGSAAENAPIMLPEMIRTAAVNLGKLTGPAGMAASAGVYALMSAQIGGAQYIENITKTDENGNPIYTPRQAALLSAFQGFAEAALEKRSIAAAGKAVFSAGTAKKLSELAAKDVALASGQTMSGVTREAAREILRERIQHGFKAGILSGAAELEEEFEQQISDMVLENMAQIAFRGGEADVSSVDEILSEAFGAAVEALPAVAGFGFMGAGGSVVADTEKVLSMRERFANAKASEIARSIYENQHHQNIVYNVAENLDNVQELQGKAPEIVTEILDAQNKKAGAEDTDVNIGMLMQMDGGADIVNQIAAENGTSQEDVQACINGTGFLTVKTSALQQAIHKMTPEQKQTVFPNVAAVGHQTNEQIISYARDMKAALEAVKDKTDKETAATIERFVRESFEDEETRKAAAEVIASDTDNPYEAAKRRVRANQADVDEYLKDTIDALKAEAGQGTSVVETMDENGDITTGRASNNPLWYQNFYADNGKAPTNADYERIAYENVTGTATRYAMTGYGNLTPEDVEYFEGVKNELDALLSEKERLRTIADALKGFGKGDFLPTASMPAETRKAYNSIYQILSASDNKKVRDNARVNAILAARMLSRLGFMWKDDAGRDVNLMEILPKLATNAVYQAQDKSALMQEMTRQIDGVRAKYEGTEQWMKAPNGQPTKLTEEQWLTVRTDAFKNWFGDWEAAIAAQEILSMPAKALTMSGKPLEKKDVEERFVSFGEVENKRYGVKATFPVNTAGKVVRHKGFDVTQISEALPRLFESSVLAKSEPEENMPGHKRHNNIALYHHFVNKFSVDGKEYYIRFTAIEEKRKRPTNERTVHSTAISEVEIYQDDKKDASAVRLRVIDPGVAEQAPFFDKKLAQILDSVNTASKVVDENGEPRVVYHGTNADFDTFSLDYLGAASGDYGFFGKGFYFAFSEGEARMYNSKRIIDAFVNLKNPLYFIEELQTYDGMRANTLGAENVAFVMNIAEKFPELAQDHVIDAWKRTGDGGGEATELSFAEFTKQIKNIINKKKFKIDEVETASGEKEYILTADKKEKTYTDSKGKKRKYTEYGFQKRFLYKKDAENKLLQAYYYLSEAVYDGIDIPRAAVVVQETDFNEALKKRGYDGVIQSKDGDEVVAFEPNQIKSATGNNGQFLVDDPNIYHQFAGEGAETADTTKLAEAQRMEADGVSAEDIYKETGWLKGIDERWRFEIPDNLDKIDFSEVIALPHESSAVELGRVYDNPALYEAYPWLKEVLVLQKDLPPNNLGRVETNINEPVIALNKTLLASDMAKQTPYMKTALVHEIQHIIQAHEGFAVGGNTRSARMQIERELDRLELAREKLSDDTRDFLSSRALYENTLLGIVEVDDETQARYKKDYDKYSDILTEEEKKSASALESKIRRLQRALIKYGEDSRYLYQHLGGEQEAREAEERAEDGAYDTMPSPHNKFDALIVFGKKEFPYAQSVYNLGENAEQALDILMQAAWHGSPHIFTKFDLGAIGTGEGAQAHGWGLYFAQDRNIAEGYKKVLEGRIKKYIVHGKERMLSDMGEKDGALYTAAILLMEQRNDVPKAIQYAEDNYWYFRNTKEQKQVIAALQNGDVKPAVAPASGALFQVEIPDDDVLLDEQKTFGEQPPKVREAIEKILGDMSDQEREYFRQSGSLNKSQDINEWTGQDIYHALSVIMGLRKHTFEGREKEASLILNQYGVQGITYDGRTDGRCFVVFDDKAIAIIDTYNQRVNGETYRGGFSAAMNFIKLFQDADESTFMHEMSHFYLNELQKIAMNAGENSQAAKDLATINGWAEWKEGDAEEYKGTASASEFAKLEADILKAEKEGNEDEAARLKNVWRQEKFARGFEEYLHEGKAPTSTLKRIFKRFKDWLKQIYKDVTGAGVKATPEVEAVFARMIASDEEIEMQATIDRVADISRIDPDLMDADTEAMHKRWAEEAKEEAKDKLRKELLKEQREKDVAAHMEAYEAEERSRLMDIPAFQAELFVQEAGLPEEEAAQAVGYASAEAWKEDLKELGGSFENAVKKSCEAERDRYIREMPNDEHLQELAEEAMVSAEHAGRLAALEAEALRRREKKYANAPKRLAKAMEGMEAALEEEKEEPLEKALRTLKYSFRWQRQQQEQIEAMQSTIDELKARIARDKEASVEAAAQSEADKEALREKMEQKAEKSKEKLRAKLKEQVNTFKAATMLNAEWLRGVRDAADGTVKLHRELSKEQLESMPIKDATNVRRFINDARKAAQECVKAIANAVRKNNGIEKEDNGEKDYEKARQAKLRESFYIAEAREARNNKREMDKIINGFKRKQKALRKDKRGEIDASTKYYINHLLYMMGVTKTDAIIPQTLESIDAHFASMKDSWQGESGANNIGDLDIDFEIPDWMRPLITPPGGTNKKLIPEDYREFTMGDLRDVQTLVNILYSTGRNKNRLLTTDKGLFDVVSEIFNDYKETVTVSENDTGINEKLAAITNPNVMLKTLGKTFSKYIYEPIAAGTEARTKMQAEAAKTLNALFDKYWNKKARKQMRDKELGIQLVDGTELTKEKVLTLALNWGNEGNRIRVLNGLTKEGRYYTTDVMIEDIFHKTMTAKDWAFVQEAWDFINGFGDKVNEVVEKTTGTPMKRVEPLLFFIKAADGEIVEVRGGYYPIAYDPDKSSAQADADLMTCAKAMGGASVFGTGLGSTKARTETGRQEAPLLLSMDVLFKHVNQQIHIATMRLACRDAYKVLTNQNVQGMFEQSLGITAYRKLKRWVENCWQEPRMDGTFIDTAMEKLRRNTVSAIMGFRMSTAALNFANPVYMMREMGVVRAVSAIVEFYKHPKQYRKWCLEQSPFLANRANNIDRDLNVTAEQSFAPKNALQEAIQRSANRAIEETDMLFSLPTYYATYQDTFNAELGKGAKLEDAEKTAHRAAEDIVRRIFGSSDTVDQSEIQRSKSAMVKAFTPFYTFAATQANAVISGYLKARYQGSTRTVKDDGTLEIVKKNVFERWGAMVNATMWTYIVGAFAEQIIREFISKATGDDDDDIEAFLREWAASSLTGIASGFPGMNVIGELIGRKITGSGYPTRSFGVASAAADRIIDALNAIYNFSQGKRDWIDTGRVIGRGIDAYYGFPDTITDAAFNFARKVDIDASFEEWFIKSLFDKKLKKKGR